MDALRVYDYLLATRERLFDAVRPLPAEAYLRSFPFGLTTLGSTLTHLYTAEWYYFERMASRHVPAYETWPIHDERPPAFAVLEAAWREQGTRVREVVAGERDWARPIGWLGFPDDRGRRFHIKATVGDCFTQLILHEAHHRAQAMVMLRELGRPLEDIDFNAIAFERTLAE